jgi:heme-degrading monooxygenase HmoA
MLALLGIGFGAGSEGKKVGGVFVRVTRFDCAPDRIDAAVESFQESGMPNLPRLEGFLGGAVLVDRRVGNGHMVTYWESAESMHASEDTANALRSQAVQQLEDVRIGEVDRFEILVEERIAPPQAGTFVRVNEVHGSPSKVDEVAAMVRERSARKDLAGFRSVIMGANRETGRMIISTSWETAADRDASDQALQELRERGSAVAGAPTVTVSLYEAAYIEVKQAALV